MLYVDKFSKNEYELILKRYYESSKFQKGTEDLKRGGTPLNINSRDKRSLVLSETTSLFNLHV